MRRVVEQQPDAQTVDLLSLKSIETHSMRQSEQEPTPLTNTPHPLADVREYLSDHASRLRRAACPARQAVKRAAHSASANVHRAAQTVARIVRSATQPQRLRRSLVLLLCFCIFAQPNVTLAAQAHLTVVAALSAREAARAARRHKTPASTPLPVRDATAEETTGALKATASAVYAPAPVNAAPPAQSTQPLLFERYVNYLKYLVGSPDGVAEPGLIAAQAGVTTTVYGPRRFDRATGQPVNVIEHFTLPSDVVAPFTINVQNGAANGSNRVSSATIRLNSNNIFTQSDFNQNVATLSRSVTLAVSNTLEVKLASQPGSYLIINITGTRVIQDTAPPNVSITSPVNNYNTTNSAIVVNGTASDTGQNASGVAHVYVNNTEAVYNPTTNTWAIANVPLQLGPNQIIARAVDAAGNQQTATINVNRQSVPQDTTPPVVAITSPTNNYETQATSISVSGTASDPGANASGVAHVYVNNVEAQRDVLAGTWTLANFQLATGSNQIVARAVDGAGNQSSLYTIIVVRKEQPPPDTQPPTVTITSPATGSTTFASSISVTGTAIDTGVNASGVRRVFVNGVEATYDAGNHTWTATGVALSGGDNPIVAEAEDAVTPTPNKGRAEIHVTRRIVAAPTLSITSPQVGAVLSATAITVAGSVSSGASDIPVTVKVNGVDAPVAGGQFTKLIQLAPGTNTITAVATDSLNQTANASVTIISDQLAPTVALSPLPSSLQAGGSYLIHADAADNIGVAAVEFSVDGQVITTVTSAPFEFTLNVPPDAAAEQVISVAAIVRDLAGATSVDTAQSRVSGPSGISGYVFDDTTGYTMQGVAATSTTGASATTQDTGAYSFVSSNPRGLVRLYKSGYTPVERSYESASGAGTALFDARLTKQDGQANTLNAAGGTATGGGGRFQVAFSAGAFPAGTDVRLTAISPQGLANLLPFGWSPIPGAVVDVRPAGASAAMTGSFTNPSQLTISQLSAMPSGAPLVLARYDESAHLWRVVSTAIQPTTNGTLIADLSGPGQYAFLVADAGATAPPAAVVSQGLPSGPSAQPSLLDAATASATASPRTAVVSPDARSTIAVTANAPTQLPSGISVEVTFEETYNLLSEANPQLVDRPTQDFVLYAYPAATMELPNRLGAFFIAKPTRSELTTAQLRTANVHVVIRSGRAATTGVLLGTGGGQITTSDGSEFRIGAGALTTNTPVFLHTLPSETAGVQLPTGYEIVGAVELDLSGATLSTGGTLVVPAVAGDTSRIVVARLISVGGQRGPKVVARAVAENGKLRSTTSSPAVPAGVQLPGITGSGRYIFIRVPSSFGYATGTVTEGAGGPAAANVKVSVDKTPFVDLTGADGRYVVVAAAGAGAAGQNEIGAASVVTDATGAATAALAAQDAVVQTALSIASTPLGVSSISPASGATDVIVTTPVTLTFTKPIAAATLTGSNFRVVTEAGNPVLGTITVLAGNRVASFTPSSTLVGSTRYRVLLSASVLDIYGKPLAAAVESSFTTAAVIPVDSRLRPERIRVSYPDADGFATVTIPAHSVPLGSTIVAINNTSGATITTIAGADAIQLRLLAHVGDEIVVLVHQPDGAEYMVSQSAYRRDDGVTSVGPNGGSVTSDDGAIVLSLPKGAITGQVDLKLTPKGEDSITLPRTGEMDPSNVRFGAGVEVKAEGNYTVEKELHLEMPAPASATEGQRVSVLKPSRVKDENGQDVDVWETVTSARVEGGKFKTTSPPFFGIALLSAFVIYIFMPTRMRVIYGNVTDLGTKLPVSNALCLIDDQNSGMYGRVLGRTNQQGRYCFFDFTISTEQSVQLKVLDEANSRVAFGTAVSPLTIPDMFAQGLTGFITMSADIGLPSVGGGGTNNPPPAIKLYGQSRPDLPIDQDPINTSRSVAIGTPVKIFAQTNRKVATLKGKVTIGGSIEQTLTWNLDSEDASNELRPQLWETSIQVTAESSYNVGVDGYTLSNVETTKTHKTFNFIGQRNPNTRPPLDGPPSVISVNPADQSTNIDASSNIRIEFSEPVHNLVGGSTVYLQEEGSGATIGGLILTGGQLVAPDTPSISSIVFLPTGGLRGNQKYTLHVTTSVVDTTSVPLDQQPSADTPGNQEFTSSFQTFGGTVINDNPIADEGFRVAVAGDYAATLTPGQAVSRVNIYDISNPQTPTPKGFINVPQRAFAFAMRDSDDDAIKLGGTVYTRLLAVATYNPLHMEQPANFWLISFDKPEAPQIIGVTSLYTPADYPSSPLSVRLLGSRAYIGTTPYQGVMVVDLYICVKLFMLAPFNNPIIKAVTPGTGYGIEAKVQTVRYTQTLNAPSAAPSIDVIGQNVTSRRADVTPTGEMPVVFAANDIGKQLVTIGFPHGTDFQNCPVDNAGIPNCHIGSQELDYRILSMTNVTPVIDGPRLVRVAQALINNQPTELAVMAGSARLWFFKVNDPVNPVQYTSRTLAELGINGSPRFLEIEGTLAYLVVNNEIDVVSFADPEHPRLMTTISDIGSNVTSIAIKDGFIYSVSNGTAARDGLNVSIARPASQVFVYGLTPGSEQRCGNPVVIDRNSRVMRQHAGIFFQVFGRNKRPASQQVIIRKNEEELATVPASLFDTTTDRLAIGQADWQTGVAIDRAALYTAELVMDKGTPDEYHSAREPIPFSYLIENYSDTIGLSMAGLVVGDEKVSYGYVIGGNSNIEFTAAGNALVGGDPRPFGLNVELLNPAGLQEGRYPFRLHAVLQSDPSVSDEVSGVLVVTRHSADLRPPGHSIVNGVDIGTGNLGISQADIPEIKNRGLSLSFVRAYNSGGANTFSAMGYGWGHNYQMRLTYTPGLNLYGIVGGDGSGQTFKAPVISGYAVITAEKPYHGTLVRNSDGSFDYFSKEYVKYHFPGALELSSYDYYEKAYMGNLAYMEAPDGNRLQLSYDSLGRMTSVTDSSSRSLNFEYEPGASPFAGVVAASNATSNTACVPSNKFNRIVNRFVRAQVGQAWLISKITGPGGLIVEYKYDADGNLIKATRRGTDGTSTATANQVWAYEYKPTTTVQTSVELKHLLKSATNPNSNITGYEYNFAQLGAPVSKITLPEAVTHEFQYTLTNGEIVRAIVTDGRGNDTTYNLLHGYVTSSDAPRGAHTDVAFNNEGLKATERDPEGMQTTYAYDSKGNLASRTMSGGNVTLTTTAEFSQKFSKPTKTVDARGNVTTYSINGSTGNVTQITLPTGLKIQLSYDGRGDLVQSIDERNLKTTYEYDAYGNPTRVVRETEPGKTVTTVNTYDVRSRLTSTTDSLRPGIQNTYDALDRIVQVVVTDPAAIRDGYTTTYSYLPGGQVKTTNTDGGAQQYHAEYTYDLLDRVTLVSETTADAGSYTRAMTYDKNSNLLTEEDRRGVLTTYQYDALNFRTKTTLSGSFGPSIVASVVAPDKLGNPLTTTDMYNQPTTFTYDGVHRLTMRTLPGSYTEKVTLDGNGNPVAGQDRNNRVTTATYDSLDRPLSIKDPAGHTQNWSYDDVTGTITHTLVPQNLTVKTQNDSLNRPSSRQVTFGGNNYQTHYVYDGRSVSMTDPRGTVVEESRSAFGETGQLKIGSLVTQRRYSALGQMKSSTDANGRTSTFTVDSLNRVVAASYPDSFSEAWAYDGANNLLTHTDRRGITSLMAYDNASRPLSTKVGSVTVETIAYQDATQNETRKDAKGQPTVYHYDGLHRPVSVLNADGNTKTYEYDGVDLRRESDFRGHSAQYEYDGVDRVTKITDRASQVTGISYNDSDGYTRTIQDRRGNQRTEVYDPLNRLKSITEGGQPLVSYEYDGDNNRTAMIDGLNNRTESKYDSLNRLTMVNHAGGQTEKFAYDNVGNLTSYEDGFASPVVQTYDGLNHLQTRTDGEGDVTRFKYDGEGLLLEQTEPKGAGSSSFKTTYTYNALRSLTTVLDAASGLWVFDYDPNQNLTSVQDPLHRTVSYGYDALNRRNSVHQPLNLSTAYEYDENGNRKKVTDAKGQTIATAFDNLDRPTTVTYSGGINNSAPLNCQYDYDPEGNLVLARETTSLENQGAVTRQYARTFDARQRMLTETDAFSHTVKYNYDAANNLTSLTDAANKQSTYSYDAANRLQTATLFGSKTVNYSWTANGLLQQVGYGTGMSRLYAYDHANRVKQIVNTLGAGQAQEYDYTYDTNSNRLTETRKLNGQTTRSLAYSYDSLDRLTQVNTTTAAPASTSSINYAYDGVGNRRSESGTDLSGASVNRNYTYDDLNRLTSLTGLAGGDLTYSYDNNGNLTSARQGGQVTASYEYDARDQLHRVLNGGAQETARYEYDHERRRINKVLAGGAEQRSVYAGRRVVDEYDAGNQLLSRYEHGPDGMLKADLAGGEGERWYFSDALDSVTALSAITTTTNAQGQPVQTAAATATYEYGAWGDIIGGGGASNNRIGYTGQRLDAETGLMALGNGERYYASGLGRFIQQDSFEGRLGTTASLNRYAYAHGNPTRYTDPSGHFIIGIIALVLIVYLGAVAVNLAYQDAQIKEGTRRQEDFSLGEAAVFGLKALPVGVGLALSGPVGLVIGAGLAGYSIYQGVQNYKAGRPYTARVDIIVGLLGLGLSGYGAYKGGYFGGRGINEPYLTSESAPGLELIKSPYEPPANVGPGQPELPFEEPVLARPNGEFAEPSSAPDYSQQMRLPVESTPEPQQLSLDFTGKTQEARGSWIGPERQLPASFDAEVEAAVDSAVSRTMFELPAQNPTTGEGLTKIDLKFDPMKPIVFQNNMTFKGIKGAPGNKVMVRYHSENPNAPAGTYSNKNPTTQINSEKPTLYMLPDGTWKPLSLMTDAEKVAAHFP